MPLCSVCRARKLVLLGITVRGLGGSSREVVDYWCEGCEIVHSYEPKDWVRHKVEEMEVEEDAKGDAQ